MVNSTDRTKQPRTGIAATANSAVFCATKQTLLQEFSDAAYCLTALHQEKFEGVIRDDPRVAQFDQAIEQARLMKDRAKHAYLIHVGEHGCITANQNV